MTILQRSHRAHAFGFGFSLVLAMAIAPAPANAGFLDQLFGGGTPAPEQPGYAPVPDAQPAMPDDLRPAAPKKRVVKREAAPVRQQTTDLMHDKTLRPGDAIMMKDGVHIYNGPEATKHSTRQFVPIDTARHVPSATRAALVAVDTTRADPLAGNRGSDTLASGRSAAIGTPIVKGFKITDARGASIRYVGP